MGRLIYPSSLFMQKRLYVVQSAHDTDEGKLKPRRVQKRKREQYIRGTGPETAVIRIQRMYSHLYRGVGLCLLTQEGTSFSMLTGYYWP